MLSNTHADQNNDSTTSKYDSWHVVKIIQNCRPCNCFCCNHGGRKRCHTINKEVILWDHVFDTMCQHSIIWCTLEVVNFWNVGCVSLYWHDNNVLWSCFCPTSYTHPCCNTLSGLGTSKSKRTFNLLIFFKHLVNVTTKETIFLSTINAKK